MGTKLVVYGTRPEEIKVWPFTQFDGFKFLEVDQSKDLHQGLIKPDYRCTEDQLEAKLKRLKPEWVIVQGDTRTAFRAALAAFHLQIPVAHVEAGLRTFDLAQPFPEEGYRRMIDSISTRLYCPTIEAFNHLDTHNARVVGQTSIDTLLSFAGHVSVGNEVLVTCHRREAEVAGIAKGIKACANAYPGLKFTVLRHPNSTSRKLEKLLKHRRVTFIDPLPYESLVERLSNCYLVMTDSGGLQEEAPSLGKPVVVLRNTTERREGIEAGCSFLGGMAQDSIYDAFCQAVGRYDQVMLVQNPYGDGNAAERIVHDLG